MTDLALNEAQITAILSEALNRELIDNMPENKEACALELVSLAKAAFNNGNRSDNVQTILFISNVDENPLPVKETVSEEPPAEIAPEVSDRIHNGIDLSTLSDGVVEGLIVGLDNYPQSEQVELDRKAYLAEKERRNEKAGKNQDDSSSTTAQAVNEKAGEAAPEGSPTPVDGGDQTVVEDRTGGPSGEQAADSGVGAADSAQGEDAGAFARAQTPETSPEGKQAKAKPVKEDGNRAALEEQLTLSIVKAHKADIKKLNSLPVAQIEFMLENPDGPGDNKVPVTDSEVEAAAITNKDVKAVGGISAEVSAPERVISKEDLGIKVDETPAGKAAEESDRESLEAQLTGPTIKAYGQGRKNIPNIGINELRFMIEHPDGKVTQEELEAAKNLDKKEFWKRDSESENKEPDSVDGEPDSAIQIAQAAKESVNKNLFEEEAVAKSPPVEEVQQTVDKDRKLNQEAVDKHNTEYEKSHSADKVFAEIDAEGQQQNRAMEIISREGFPIPPAYSDEQAPVFPMDVSQCTRDELFSYHARYHAYEMRINYILAEHEDRLNDCVQLRSYREAVVAKEVPFMGEDGKRNTNEFRDAQIRGDKEVLELGEEEHEKKKIVTDLKVHQKNFHLCCERLSRQMSKYEREIADSPR